MTVADQAIPEPGERPAKPVPGGLLEVIAAIWGAGDRTVLTASEPHYRQLLDAIDIAVYTTDAAGRINYYNEAAARLWGRRPELGEEWCGSWRLFWPDGRPMPHRECPMAIALNEGRAIRGEDAIAERPDGTRVAFLPHPTPLRSSDGTVVGAVNVMVDITDRKLAENALHEAADSLRRSNAVKDEFLGLISHELRTPVTTIFGNARLLADRADSLPVDLRRAMVADIATDSERLLGIVENLLLLTRLESVPELDLEPQVIGHVVRASVEAFRRRAPARPIDLRIRDRDGIVEADATYLDLLVTNLLTNANKYSPPGRPVEVETEFAGSEVHVRVLDRGIGLSEADAEKVFTPFYRSEAAKSSADGIGIGLSVCRRVVEIQGGRIWGRPRSGGGAEFGFAFPRRTTDELP